MKIATLPQVDYADVAAKLRELATFVEKYAGEGGSVSCIVVLGLDNEVEVIARGHRTSRLEIQGWMERARHIVNTESQKTFQADGVA